MLASASKRTPHPIPLPRRGLGGERVPGGRVRGVLHGPKFLRGYIARSEHEAQAGGFASATAFGLRRLVAAFVRERKPSRLALDGAASKSASKLAHSKRCRATVRRVRMRTEGRRFANGRSDTLTLSAELQFGPCARTAQVPARLV